MYRDCVHDDTFNWHSYLYLEPGFFDVAYIDRACLRAHVDPLFSQSCQWVYELTGIFLDPLQQRGSQGNFNCHLLITHTWCLLMPTDAYTNPSEDVIDGCYLGCNYVSTWRGEMKRLDQELCVLCVLAPKVLYTTITTSFNWGLDLSSTSSKEIFVLLCPLCDCTFRARHRHTQQLQLAGFS